MALLPCKICKKEVAHNAKTCPHCGVKDPSAKTRDIFFGLTALAAIFTVIAVSCSDEKENKDTQTTVECLKDLQCIGAQGAATAATYCPDKVEKLTQNPIRWTDNLLESKFSRYRWKNQEYSVVQHLGDKAQFQNAVGEWVNFIYACDIDMKQNDGEGTVIRVELVSEGRLSD